MNAGLQTEQVRLSLRTSFSWAFVGNLVYAASQWAILAVLTRSDTPEMVGQFALGLAVTTPVMMLTNLNLRGIQATDARRDFCFADYLGLRLATTMLALLIIAAIVLSVDFTWEIRAIILAIGGAKAVESVSDIFYGLIQQHERMDRIAQSLMLKGPLSLAVVMVITYFTGQLFWSVIGMGIVWSLILVGWDLRSGALVLRERRLQAGDLIQAPMQAPMKERKHPFVLIPRWHARTLQQLLVLSLPLGVVMMFIALNSNMPRYFIEENLGTSALGLFAAVAYLQTVGSTIVLALGESAMPRLAKYYTARDGPAYFNLLLQLIGVGGLLGLGGVVGAWLVGKPLLTLLYQPEYAQLELLMWLMLAAGVSYMASFLGYGMMAAHYFRLQIPLFAIVAATTAGACWWLIPAYQLVGAAMALLLAAAVQAVISALVILQIKRSLSGKAASGAEAYR